MGPVGSTPPLVLAQNLKGSGWPARARPLPSRHKSCEGSPRACRPMPARAGLTLISCRIKATMCDHTGHCIGLGAKQLSTWPRVRRSLGECHKAMTNWRGMKTLFISTVRIWARLEAGVWPEAELEPSLQGLEQRAKQQTIDF